MFVCFNVWHMSNEMIRIERMQCNANKTKQQHKWMSEQCWMMIQQWVFGRSRFYCQPVHDADSFIVSFMKMDVNQFIYPRTLQIMILDNSYHPNRAPAPAFCISYVFFVVIIIVIDLFVNQNFENGWPIFFLRWDGRNLAMVFFLWFCISDSILHHCIHGTVYGIIVYTRRMVFVFVCMRAY